MYSRPCFIASCWWTIRTIFLLWTVLEILNPILYIYSRRRWTSLRLGWSVYRDPRPLCPTRIKKSSIASTPKWWATAFWPTASCRTTSHRPANVFPWRLRLTAVVTAENKQYKLLKRDFYVNFDSSCGRIGLLLISTRSHGKLDSKKVLLLELIIYERTVGLRTSSDYTVKLN